MALKIYDAPIIHHSDRGSQYGYKDYINLLEANNTHISMGDIAQDNAYAERINRTIKEEYLNYWETSSFKQLKTQVNRAVKHYNTKRKHNGIFRNTPLQFYEDALNLQVPNRRFWLPIVRIV